TTCTSEPLFPESKKKPARDPRSWRAGGRPDAYSNSARKYPSSPVPVSSPASAVGVPVPVSSGAAISDMLSVRGEPVPVSSGAPANAANGRTRKAETASDARKVFMELPLGFVGGQFPLLLKQEMLPAWPDSGLIPASIRHQSWK